MIPFREASIGTMNPSRYATHLRLVGMAALWGASWPWGRVVAQAMPPITAACLRFLLASLVLLLWLHQSGRMAALRTITLRQWAALGCASALGITAYSICFMLALTEVPASKAAQVVALNPVLTLFFAVLLFRDRVNWVMCIGVVLAVTGALFALSDGSLAALLPGQSGAGELLLLGCAGCWVAYTLIGRMVLTTLDSLTTTAATAAIGAVFLFIASMIMEGPAAWGALPDTPAMAWASILALAFGATALAYAWYLSGVKVLGPGAAAAYISLVPLFGMLFSSLWLGEALTLSLLIGGAMAITGMLLMNLGRMRLTKTAT
jgi:drug/metabolite transporter (DMT)-like permease